MRGLLALVFSIGFAAMLVAQLASRSTDPAVSQPRAVEEASQTGTNNRFAELRTQNSARFGSQDGAVELQRSPDGHFYADVRVNDTYVHMLVDTGASVIALSRNLSLIHI